MSLRVKALQHSSKAPSSHQAISPMQRLTEDQINLRKELPDSAR
jgi:hypothetical protein